MTRIDKLKFDLKRINKRKAAIEREIENLEFDEFEDDVKELGLNLSKLYRVDDSYVNWCKSNNISCYGSVKNVEYYIEGIVEKNLVRVKSHDGISIVVPVELLIEVENV